MPDLVTLAQAKRHLRLDAPGSPPTDEDVDVAEKITQASALVADYVSQRLLESEAGSPPTTWAAEVASWDAGTSPTSVPERIQAATLAVLADLWRFRGDDEREGPEWTFGLPTRAKQMIDRYRDPALA